MCFRYRRADNLYTTSNSQIASHTKLCSKTTRGLLGFVCLMLQLDTGVCWLLVDFSKDFSFYEVVHL